MLRRPAVEHECRPESCGMADWAARRLYEILLLLERVGQLIEEQVQGGSNMTGTICV